MHSTRQQLWPAGRGIWGDAGQGGTKFQLHKGSSGDLMYNYVTTATDKKPSNCGSVRDGNSIAVVKFCIHFEGISQEDLVMK